MAKYQIKIGVRPVTVGSPLFVVVSTKNTTEHLPGEILTKEKVDELCKNYAWEVTLVSSREDAI